jgi:hypothetical protein
MSQTLSQWTELATGPRKWNKLAQLTWPTLLFFCRRAPVPHCVEVTTTNRVANGDKRDAHIIQEPRENLYCRIWGSHRTGYQEFCLLEYNAV